MEQWADQIYDLIGMSHSVQYKIVSTLIMWGILYALRRFVTRLLLLNQKDIKIQYTWKKGIQYGSYILFFIIISPIWITELQSMGTFLGLLTAGLAVALKDPISNLFAWVYIVFKKPFEMGDRVQIGNSEGDILDIGFFEFTMMEIKNWVNADQSTGRIIHIPNGLLFTRPVVNYNQAMNNIWNEIPILITYESNWEKAKKILLEIEEKHLKKLVENSEENLNKAYQKYHVKYSVITPTVYTNIQDSGILLTLRYLCPPRRRRWTQQIVIEEILKTFALHSDIEFAYPTTRFYNAQFEDKHITHPVSKEDKI